MAKYSIPSYDYVFTFGKHKGKTCGEVAENDPSYLIWLHVENVADIDPEIYEGALIDDANNSPPEEWFWQPD